MVRTFLCQPLTDPKVFSDDYEPACGCCTRNGLVLIASGSTNDIYVYSATGRAGCKKLFAFQSIGAARKLVHCSFGNYILSLERKWQDPRNITSTRPTFQYARVYVNWIKEPDDRPYPIQHRSGYTREPLTLYNCAGEFSAIDIPVKYSVNDISCCDTNGNIAISTEAKVYLFAFKETTLTGAADNTVIDFDCSLEIDSGFQINNVALFGSYIAFASAYEIRVIQVIIDEKDSVIQAEEVSEILEEDRILSKLMQGESSVHCSLCNSVTDQNFVSWNIEQGSSMGLDSLEHETITIQRKKTTSSLYGSPTYMVNNSCIKFEAVAQDATYVNLDNTVKEIIGPKEFLSGHPLIVINSIHDLGFVGVNHVTILYRRFLNEVNDLNGNSGSIHSIQWVPMFTDECAHNSTLSTSTSTSTTSPEGPATAENKNRVLVSLGLFFSTGRKGYLYETLNTPKLLTEYDFTETCISACLTRSLLHVVTKNGLETYTTRLYSSASLGAKAYHGEDNVKLARERQRTYSSASFSSWTDGDRRTQLYEPMYDFGSDETFQEDIIPREAHFTEVSREPKAASVKSKTKLSFKSRKNRVKAKADCDSPSSDSSATKADEPSCFAAFADRPKDVLYGFRDLIKPCPPSTIEVCLIGIYPLRGFIFIGSTDKHIVLLQKAFEFKGKRGSVPKERVMPWNVYVREISPAIDVYRDIVKLIEGSEFANPSVFHQLLSEAHMILRADLTSSTPEDRREVIRASIKRSAVKLGDFFARCSSGFDFLMAKEYYEMTGIKLEQVLLRHAKRDREENLAKRYGVGIIEFLNEKLIKNVDQPVQLSEDSVYHIMKIYSVAAPHVLSTLILKSRLHNIPADKAVSIMEQFEGPESSSPDYGLSTLDYIAMADLHLRLCDPNNAEHTLRRISNEELTGAIVNSPELILMGGDLTHLGQLLRKHFRTAFTSLLVLLFDNGNISLEAAVVAYGYGIKDSTGTSSSPNYKMWDLLESLLGDEKRKDHYPEILNYLLEQYFASLQSKNSVTLLTIPHQHIPKGNGHFASRFEWLDKLPPFSGESPAPQDCLLRKQMRPSASKGINSNGSPNSTTTSNQQFDYNQACGCCCCNAVLLKIQSLLCSKFCLESTYLSVMNFVEKSDYIFQDSVKLLCYPAIGKVPDAVTFVITNHPSVMLLYAKSIFLDNKAKWQIFLDFLLKTLREELYERWNKDTYLDALKGALTKLVRLCKPSEFLELLPKDGTARFFMPFIQDCHQIHNALSLRAGILRNYEPATA